MGGGEDGGAAAGLATLPRTVAGMGDGSRSGLEDMRSEASHGPLGGPIGDLGELFVADEMLPFHCFTGELSLSALHVGLFVWKDSPDDSDKKCVNKPDSQRNH